MPDIKKIKTILPGLFLLCTISMQAQVIENHIGFRAGIQSGIYYQNMIVAGNAEKAFHASLTANTNSFRLTILRLTYEMNLNDLTENLFLVWGYGGHLGFAFTDHTWFLGKRYQFAHERYRPLAGIDCYGGLEYRVIGIPLAIGLNIKPYAEIMVPGFIKIQPADIGLTVAYRF